MENTDTTNNTNTTMVEITNTDTTTNVETTNKNTTSVTPSRSTITRITLLVLRVLTFVFLLIALIIIALTNETKDIVDDDGDDGELEIDFQDIHAYRYMISTIVIGFAYNLLQMAHSIFIVISGKRVLQGDICYMLDFFGDKIISYFLLSGSAAGFGASEDLHRLFKLADLPLNSFFEKADASASLLFIGFMTTAIASIFTSLAFPKKS